MSEHDDEFSAFVIKHQKRLLRVAYATTGTWTHAEDVLQMALIKLYGAWPRLERLDGYGYAQRIVLRSAVDHWRRRHRELPAGDQFDIASPENGEQRLVERLDLVAAIQKLPKRQRQVIVARYLCELSVEETARELRLRTGTVKSHCSRGIERLNELMGPGPTEKGRAG